MHEMPWPAYDPEMVKEDEVEIPVQVNGKLRAKITMPTDAEEETVKEKALQDENVQRAIEDKEVRKVIFIKGRLINIVAN